MEQKVHQQKAIDTDKDNKSAENKNTISVPQINLPKGGGAIKGIDEKFSVNAVNGTVSFDMPLPFSSARGFSPSLNLKYNSGAGNGLFGIGWSLNLSSIKRKTEKELPRYFDDTDADTYIISEAEDLTPEFKKDNDGNFLKDNKGKFIPNEFDLPGSDFRIKRYRPRIEGLFARIERWTDKTSGIIHWRIVSKTNTTTVYGNQPSAVIACPSDDKKIFEWLPSFIYDDKGNCAVYTYKTEDKAGIPHQLAHNKNRLNGNTSFSNTYLKRIRYGNITPFKKHDDAIPADFMFETVFDYGEHNIVIPFAETKEWAFRQDAFSNYRAGFEIRTCRLCKRVLLYYHFTELPGGSALIKSLNITYTNNGEEGLNFLSAATLTGYTKQDDGSYTEKSFPPLSFEYQPHEWNHEIKTISTEDLVNAPSGIDENNYQFTDLYSEGLAGILTEQADAWFYKSNLGDGHFTRAFPVMPKPSFKGLKGTLQLTELEGNGIKHLSSWGTEPRGFFELSPENEWQPFKTFEALPNINFNDTNTKLLDVNGDGFTDVLVTEDDVFIWYPSAGKKGFKPAEKIIKGYDEEKGAALVFADGTETIFLADMSGDGLTDIVRIRNSEVAYWPNLGYGKFGAKISMDNAPVFDQPERFNPAAIKLADVAGSGTTDIIYCGQTTVNVWLNQNGNAFAKVPVTITDFPPINNLSSLSVIDLLGTGMSCLVFNSALPSALPSPLRYIDIMNSRKPHIIKAYKNNMGREIYLQYKPSTKFYIEDKLTGKPWVTKLHFPVHCIYKTETHDRILKTHFVTEYNYHHGYYDHIEREFRGFGMVEAKDSEDFEHFIKQDGTVIESHLHQPPVLTKTWYHTGAFFNRQRILNQFKNDYNKDSVAAENLLPEPLLPAGLTADEMQQALRACKGTLLRKEVYALDADLIKQHLPYLVEQHNCLIKLLQPAAENKYAVFYTHESEAITYHYERDITDPRIAHNFILDVDAYGNVTGNAAVVYARRKNDPSVFDEQKEKSIIYTSSVYTNDIADNNNPYNYNYRSPLLYESKTYHVNTNAPLHDRYYKIDELKAACENAVFKDYHQSLDGFEQKRLIEFVRTQYRADDGLTVLNFGILQSKALVHQSYKAALTQAMLTNTFAEKIPFATLQPVLIAPANGAYIFADDYFWIGSGTQNYDIDHFFLSTQFTNQFGNSTTVEYDGKYDLFIKKITDAKASETVTEGYNFRTLSPYIITDINNNKSAIRFDELGLVIKSFNIGKKGVDKGDEFDNSKVEIKDAADFPSIEMQYNVSQWYNQTQSAGFDINNYKPQPNFIRSLTRETHYHADALHETKIQESYTYTDGAGKTTLTKVQAEPGIALQVNGDGTVSNIDTSKLNPVQLRWVGNGKTILNNKGNPVKQYEPYFTIQPGFDDEQEMVQLGVTPVLHYDPLDRVIKTDFPNQTFSSVEFTPWQQANYDANDNVKQSGWYAQLGKPDPLVNVEPADAEHRAAWLTAKHDNTPVITHLDSLGRVFLTITNKGSLYINAGELPSDNLIVAAIKYDIEGNKLELSDGLLRKVMQHQYNMLGNKIIQVSMDAGKRWILNDVAGKPLLSWDDRNHAFSFEYDELRRPVKSFVATGNATPVIYNRIDYGEGQAADKDNNLRGKIYRQYDQAGIVINAVYDFKNNLLNTSRQLVKNYKTTVEWNNIATLTTENEVYENSTAYDALNRPTKVVMPHLTGTVAIDINEIYPSYNEAGLLNKVEVKKRSSNSKIAFVTNINYNAKAQREEVFYGNNTTTKYEYDPLTFRLKRLFSTRKNGAEIIQDLKYTCDPVGNITQVNDEADVIIKKQLFFDGENVAGINKYEFDAMYRLVKATGRKHAGQTDINHVKADFNYRNHPFVNSAVINPNDVQAFRNYTEAYLYDKAGNMLEQKQTSKGGSGFTRSFIYNSGNNHLKETAVGNNFSFKYIDTANGIDYDPHGNITLMEHIQHFVWNYADQCTEVDLGGGGKAYYVYDAGGQRTRKVIERLDGSIKERIYLGGIEVYREKNNEGTITLERETLHVMDDRRRIAMMDTPVTKPAGNAETQLVRYNYDNHLGSSSIELDDTADAKLISYEEYFPFGTTSYYIADTTREVAAKRYRYTAKERDEESGLNYHEARYYAPWLCRWTAADPSGVSDGLNVYTYVSNNPVVLFDPDGLDGEGGYTLPPSPEYRLKLDPKTEAMIKGIQASMLPGQQPAATTPAAPPIDLFDKKILQPIANAGTKPLAPVAPTFNNTAPIPPIPAPSGPDFKLPDLKWKFGSVTNEVKIDLTDPSISYKHIGDGSTTVKAGTDVSLEIKKGDVTQKYSVDYSGKAGFESKVNLGGGYQYYLSGDTTGEVHLGFSLHDPKILPKPGELEAGVGKIGKGIGAMGKYTDNLVRNVPDIIKDKDVTGTVDGIKPFAGMVSGGGDKEEDPDKKPAADDKKSKPYKPGFKIDLYGKPGTAIDYTGKEVKDYKIGADLVFSL